MRQLTERQKAVFNFIVKRTREGKPPTIREIGDNFHITSPNGVMAHITALERKGLLRRGLGQKSRSIEVVRLKSIDDARERIVSAAVSYVNIGIDGSKESEDLARAVDEYQRAVGRREYSNG